MANEELDKDAATELSLFIDNDGALYRQHTVPTFEILAFLVILRLIKTQLHKMAQGKYDKTLAEKRWR